MRTQILVLLVMLGSVNASCETTRLGRIHAGMTRTDVAVELGKPANIRVDQEGVFWTYPSSESKVCTIKFINQRVSQEPMNCDDSAASKELASQAVKDLPTMNSEVEYQGRVRRYCGVKPIPRPGCRISEQCINGGWEELCN